MLHSPTIWISTDSSLCPVSEADWDRCITYKPLSPAVSTMDFPWHSGKVLEQLNHQRQLGLLCDCTFVVDGIDFKAHKAVLAACSAYFRTLFLDQKDVVHLDISNAAGMFVMPTCVWVTIVLFLCFSASYDLRDVINVLHNVHCAQDINWVQKCQI